MNELTDIVSPMERDKGDIMLTLFRDPLFDDIERAFWGYKPVQNGLSRNIREDKTGAYVTLEVPGFRPEDISVTIEDDVLSVVAKKENDTRRWSYRVSSASDTEAIHASAEHGILTITIPKKPERLPRQITVKGTDN